MLDDAVGSTLMRLIHSLSAASDSGSEREEEKQRLEARFKESDAKVADLVSLHRDSLTAVTKSYALVSRKLSIARKKIGAAKTNLLACRELLHYKRDELKRLWLDGFEQKHIFVMLEKIEVIKECPEVIEGLLGKRKMIEATKCLVGHLHSLENELKSVEGLSELKGHLLSKKDGLYKVIMEDLKYQLYVRSTHDMFALRRQASMRESGQFIRTASGGASKNEKGLKDRRQGGTEHAPLKGPTTRKWNDSNNISAYLNGRLLTVAEEEEWMTMLDNPLKVSVDGGGPPSAIIVYVECLTQLNLLPTALDQLRTDLRSELLSIVQKTSKQILDMYPSTAPGSEESHLFLELFNSLVEQFYLIADAYRLLSIAVKASSGRHGHSVPGLEATLVWDAVQAAVKTILSDYLIFNKDVKTGEGEGGNSREYAGKNTSTADYYFLKKRSGRQRKISLFKFDHSSTALNMSDYAKEQRNENSLQTSSLVCTPNPHNITTIYPSLMEFISEIDKSLGTPNAHCSLYTFLSDYVKEDFLGVINYEISEDLQQASISLNSWETETEIESLKALRSNRPLLKSTVLIKKALDRLLSIMNTLYLYRVHFFNCILKIVSQYKEIVEKAFRGVLRGANNGLLKPSGILASDEDLLRLNKSFPIWDSSSGGGLHQDLKTRELLNRKEIFLIQNKISSSRVALDILSETSQLVHLATLCESLDWLSAQISAILSKTSNVPEKSLHNLHSNGSELNDLSSSILLVLHLEIRLHALHYLSPLLNGLGVGFTGGSEAPDASPEVLRLASDLTAAEDALSPILSGHKGVYVFEGLLYMLGSLLIHSSAGFKRIDGNGIKKMSRNLFTLQYILSSYISGHGEMELEAAKQYFEMLSKSSEELLNGIVEKGRLFSHEEYENAIRLLHRSLKGSSNSEQLENDLTKLETVLKMNS